MAKNMALIEDGVVTNILWCSNSEEETKSLKELANRPVRIGDAYSNGNFYRNDRKVLTPFEEAQAALSSLEAENAALKEDNSILTAQVTALSDQLDFYEDCIAEMAEVIYA